MGWALLAAAVVMLAAAVFLGASMVNQSQALQANVAFTQAAVDANVRTLSQVQRELLRVEVLLAGPEATPAAWDLQLALVDQRVQEGALPLQAQTLGSDELLARSASLANSWTTDVRPLVARAAQEGEPWRTSAMAAVVGIEKDYNALVSDGEINRRVQAGEANNQTRQLLSQARTLLIGLAVTLTAFLIFTAVSARAFRQLNRHREAAAAQLRVLNEELRTVNAELRTNALVVHATDNLVVVTDDQGCIEWVNAAFERTTGYLLDTVRGRRPGELLQSPDTDPETVAMMRAAVADGRPFTAEVLSRTAAGRPYWVRVEAHPVHDDQGRLTNFIAVESDVTERRRTEEHLRTAADTALSLAQEKASFLATMSHEIRTPLNAVIGMTELLGFTDLDDEQADYVRTANNSGRLLLGLINDILDFSAMESGHVEVEHRAFRIRRTVDEVIGMFGAQAAARDVAVRSWVAESVPDLVTADENRLRQVMVNLVGNGLKFTHHGEVSVHVEYTDEPGQPRGRGGRLRMTVSDTGIGIPTDRQDRIFLPFTQVDPSTTRRYGGSGLGLSICWHIVRHLGGVITVDSEVGRGSTFTVELPIEESKGGDQCAVTVPDDAVVDAATSFGDLKVLVAEDDAVNRMVVTRMLSRLGVQADVALDGAAAVAAAGKTCYDVILMDVHMPILDGVAATAAIRNDPDAGRPWIAALTANALDGDRDKLLDAGMDGYVSKPVTVASLTATLTEAKGSRLAVAGSR